MYHGNKGLYRATVQRVVGFGDAVKRLGQHEVSGHMVNYNPIYVRAVLRGDLKSNKMLELIFQKAPEIFDVCRLCDAVKQWVGERRKMEVA